MSAPVVQELWRYPVKSMGGQRVASVAVTARGLHADRLWAVRDLALEATTTARRLPALMQCSARYAGEPPADAGPGRPTPVIVTLPDGDELASDDPRIHARLSDFLGRRVELRPLPATDDKRSYRGARMRPDRMAADLRRQFDLEPGEPFPDLSMLPLGRLAELTRYATPVGTFADAYPLHLLTTGSMTAMRTLTPDADFDVRRFRPNIVLSGADEFGWCGGTLTSGDLRVEVIAPTVRCSMPIRPQPGLEAQPDVIRTIKAHSHRCLGVYADVTRAGGLAEGDALRLDPPQRRGAPRAVAHRAKQRLVQAATRAVLRG